MSVLVVKLTHLFLVVAAGHVPLPAENFERLYWSPRELFVFLSLVGCCKTTVLRSAAFQFSSALVRVLSFEEVNDYFKPVQNEFFLSVKN